MKTIIQDTREKEHFRLDRTDYFITQGYRVELQKLEIGDYAIKGKLNRVVDYKMSIQEMIGNIQESTLSKTKVGNVVKKMCENYDVPSHVAGMIYELIIADDLEIDIEPMLYEIGENAGLEPMQCRYLINLYRAYRTRLHRLLVKAKRQGVKLYFLVANDDGVIDLESLKKWKNPRIRYSPRAMTGKTLAKAMETMESKYFCKFLFCKPEEQGEQILRLLEGADEN